MLRRKLLQLAPADARQRRLLANNHQVQGDIRRQTNEPTESLKNSQVALEVYAQLLAEEPDSIEVRLALAQTNHNIGQLLSTNGKKADSFAYFQKTLDATDELRQRFLERTDLLVLRANAHKQIGNSLSWEQRQAQSEVEMAKAIAIYESPVAVNPIDANLQTGLYQTYMMTSSVYEEVHDALAHDYAFKARNIIEARVAKDPANMRAKQQLAKTY